MGSYWDNNATATKVPGEWKIGRPIGGEAKIIIADTLERKGSEWIKFGMLPSWRRVFTSAPLLEEEKISTWQSIRPTIISRFGPTTFAHIKHYNESFKETILSKTPLAPLGRVTVSTNVDHSIFETYGQKVGSDDRKYLPVNLAHLLSLETESPSVWGIQLARLWGDIVKGARNKDSAWAEYPAWQEAVYKFYGHMWGIDYTILPTGNSKNYKSGKNPFSAFNHQDSWDSIFGGWSKSETWNMDSFRDVLLYLYLEPANSRKTRAANLASDLAGADEAIDKDGLHEGDVLEVLKNRYNTRIERKINNNKALSSSERSALKALSSKNDDYFRNISKQAAQCILRMNLLSYTQPHKLVGSSVVANKGAGTLRHIDKTQNPYFAKDRYHKSIYLDYGNSASLVNKLTYSPFGDHFLNIRTDAISQLMPMIRLYKSYYNTSGKLTQEVEFSFDGGTDPLSNRPGVGIKSFDWSLNATNPATIRNDIEAKLVLYFQDFKELNKERFGYDVISGADKKFQYKDLLLRPPVTGITTTTPSKSTSNKRTISEHCREKQKNNSKGLGDFYEIKALVGWADPVTPMPLPGMSVLNQVNLKDSIKNQQLSMFLNLIDHSFSITQEGTFELEITYRARLSALATDPRVDVLTTPNQKVQIDRYLEEIDKAQKNCDPQSNIDDYREEISRIREIDRDALGSALLTGMQTKIYTTKIDQDAFNRLVESQATEDPRPRKDENPFLITTDDVINSINEKASTIVTEALSATERRLVESMTPSHPDYDAEAQKEANRDDPNASLELGYLVDGENVHIPWFYFGDLINVAVEHLQVEAPNKENADGVIPTIKMENLSFLFGNFPVQVRGFSKKAGEFPVLLVDTVNIANVPITLEMFNQWYTRKIIEPDRQTYSILEFIRDLCDDLVRATLNRSCFDGRLAKWWATASSSVPTVNDLGIIVVDQTYFYEIPDLIFKTTSVSLPSLFLKTEEKPIADLNKLGENPLEKYSIFGAGDTVPLATGIKGSNIKETSLHNNHPGSFINSDSFEPARRDTEVVTDGNLVLRKENSHDQTLSNCYHLMVFYFINDDSYRKFGPPKAGESVRYIRDLEEGVFHLVLAADAGIFKSVQFSKTDAPFLREARIQQASLDPLSQLAATYDVTLKLIGNTLFWPGQYIFINPIGFGSGLGSPTNVESISNALGLGGYHLITSVKSYIEEGKYETEITARFEFSGDGCPSLPGSTTQPCDEML